MVNIGKISRYRTKPIKAKQRYVYDPRDVSTWLRRTFPLAFYTALRCNENLLYLANFRASVDIAWLK